MSGERGYLDLLKHVLEHGHVSGNRTGIDTHSIFGAQLRFSLRQSALPMITTKFVSFPTIAKELLWFISGSTNQRDLEDVGVKIWRANSSPDYLRTVGLHTRYRPYTDLGPIYGFQWRHWGTKYIDSTTDYTNQGIDQLSNVVHEIRNNPTSRRILLTAWNPSDLPKMVLSPCHCMVQFRVMNDELSAHLYQRSADLALGVPYNITSYSLLTHILARICGLRAGELIHTFGDAHIYANHIDGVRKQIKRKPFDPPTILVDHDVATLSDIRLEKLHLTGYRHHERIVYDMAV